MREKMLCDFILFVFFLLSYKEGIKKSLEYLLALIFTFKFSHSGKLQGCAYIVYIYLGFI